MNVRLVLFCFLFSQLTAGELHAQDSLTVRPGDRVRVRTIDTEECQPCIGIVPNLLVLGVLGAGSGAAIGASSREDRWQTVPLESMRINLGVHLDCRGLVPSVGF